MDATADASAPPPPAHWLPLQTPTPAAEAFDPIRDPPGYVPVPMRAFVDMEEVLAFVSPPTSASGIVCVGARMEGIDTATPPHQ